MLVFGERSIFLLKSNVKFQILFLGLVSGQYKMAKRREDSAMMEGHSKPQKNKNFEDKKEG